MNAKAKKTTKTPRPKTDDEPSADASPRFKRLIQGDAAETTAPAAAADPYTTMADLGKAWIEHLKANDAAVSTWASYQADFEIAVEHFGAATDPATLTPEAVAAYEQTDAVMKTKKGRPKAMPTVLKTRRVLRLALTWARDAGRLASIPYAAKVAS